MCSKSWLTHIYEAVLDRYLRAGRPGGREKCPEGDEMRRGAGQDGESHFLPRLFKDGPFPASFWHFLVQYH